MLKNIFYFIIFSVGVLCASCAKHPSKVEIMRQEKQQKDSIAYVQARQNLTYSDSVLQVLLPQTEPLLKKFVYFKDEKAEDHGHYVHRLLQTTSNTTRNFIQAYVSDNRVASIQSYYYGAKPHHQQSLRLSIDEGYIEKQGSNHAFQLEGWHEILTIDHEDAIELLAYIYNHVGARVRVSSIGQQSVVYYLSTTEQQALADTYQLAVLMRDIDALERAIHVSNLQIQKYEKKHADCK